MSARPTKPKNDFYPSFVMPNFFVEGYGCSLNKSDTEQIRNFLESRGFSFSQLEKADFAIINTCAVKQPTEFKMLKRIRSLFFLSKKFGFKIIVFGCLAEINPKEIEKISPTIIQIGPRLEKLAEFFSLDAVPFAPELPVSNSCPGKLVSILPICRGCLGECAFCAVKKARGALHSYSIESLDKKFKELLKHSKEIWLTAQDTGCYGKDIGTSLAKLLKTLLQNQGDYRVRIGMMNPHHLKKMLSSLLKLLNDKRIYLFLHVPLQSGSDRMLKLMNRKYDTKLFVSAIKKIRKEFPGISLSTDIIVGFPSETEGDFKKTLAVLKKLEFDIVNVSRYGKRPFTSAAKMLQQVFEWEKKKRSRSASELCKQISLKRNKRFLGKTMQIFVNEKGRGKSFVGRSQNYKPVVIMQNRLGEFVKVKIKKAFPTYLIGESEQN